MVFSGTDDAVSQVDFDQRVELKYICYQREYAWMQERRPQEELGSPQLLQPLGLPRVLLEIWPSVTGKQLLEVAGADFEGPGQKAPFASLAIRQGADQQE